MEREVREKLLSLIPSVNTIYLFGSFAKSEFNKDSDIDIGFMADTKLSSIEVFHAAQQLAAILNCDIDLVDVAAASLVMQFQILSTGKTIYARDSVSLLVFEARIISMYQRFNEERKLILEEVSN